MDSYDVVVIGGGAAGLAGATALARSRRSVLVVDAGEPRNAPAAGVHNYLGSDGLTPGELLARGRAEAVNYGAEIVDGRVTRAEQKAASFHVAIDGARWVRGRRLLVATGARDTLPDVAGLEEGWGTSVLHCPYCHGWEARDRAVAVLALHPSFMHAVGLWRQLTEDLVVFLHEQPRPAREVTRPLELRGVRFVEGVVAAWEREGVRMVSGQLVARDVLTTSSRVEALGVPGLDLDVAEVEVAGTSIGRAVVADPSGKTSVRGVWAAGNVTNPTAQVISSAAAGLGAAAMMNLELVDEDNQNALRASLVGQPAWEARYAEQPDQD